jgi:hypothetical protein
VEEANSVEMNVGQVQAHGAALDNVPSFVKVSPRSGSIGVARGEILLLTYSLKAQI